MLAPTKANKVKALRDYWTFVDLIDFKGGRNAFAPIHHELGEFVTRADTALAGAYGINGKTRKLILMPRGHLKSTVASVGYVLWRIYRNPNIRIVVGTNVKDLAWSFIRELRAYLEDDYLKEKIWNARPHVSGPLIPELDRSGRRKTGDNTESVDKKVIWSATAIQVVRDKKMKEPTVQATSVGSRLTGGHFDLLILDDIVDFRNTASPDLIKRVFEWAQDLESVLDPRRVEKVGDLEDAVGDQVVVLGTRYDRQDFYAYLLENLEELEYESMIRNIYVNGKDPTEGYIWGERFSDTVIQKLRKRLTPRRFASQYLNTIIVSEEQPLNPDNVHYFSDQFVKIRPGEVEIMQPITKNGEMVVRAFPRVRPYLVVDPAISEKKGADNTSIAVGGFDQYGDLWILDQFVGHFRPGDTADIIYRMVNKWKLNFVHIEQVGAFKALAFTVSEYLKNRGIHAAVKEYKPGLQKKKSRIENFLEPYFRNSTIHCSSYIHKIDIVQNEIQFFPNDTMTDDVLDSWSMLVEIARPPLTEAQTQYKRKLPVRAFRNVKYGGTRV